MSEKEKVQNSDVEIKKFEEEVEEAIDELFVPLSAGGQEETEGNKSGDQQSALEPADEKNDGRPSGEEDGKEEKVDVPNLESSIEAAIDELFVDTTSHDDREPQAVETQEVISNAPEETVAEDTPKEADLESGDQEGIASEQQVNAEIVDSLKEKLLSLDWEISAANIKAMEKALTDIPAEILSDAKIVSIVKMMQGVLKYLATVRYSASPLSIQFLRDAMEALERFMLQPAMEEEEGKKIIGDLVNKFRRLKYEAKKYRKVKTKKEPAARKIEERELPAEVIPDVLSQIDQIEKSMVELAQYSKKIRVCVNRVHNLLSRYERLQQVLERKPALAKVSNYFGETTRGMVQEISGIEGYLRMLQGIYEEGNEALKRHREILEKKSVGRSQEEVEKLEEKREPAEKEAKDDAISSAGKDEPEAELDAGVEKTLVVPPPVGDELHVGSVAGADVPSEVAKDISEEAQQDVPEAMPDPEEREEIPEIEVPPVPETSADEKVTVAEGVETPPDLPDEEAAVPEEESIEKEEMPEISAQAEEEVSESMPDAPTGETTFETVYLVTVAGKVLAIPSRFVANVYSLPERKIGLISSKGYAFLKELKPFYRSIKYGLAGPLAQKTKNELKSLKANVVKLDLKSLNVSEDSIPEKQKGIVLLSDGEHAVLLCTDESVSKRPTPVTNYEGNHMEGCLSGRVEIEGQFNVPVLDVEQLLSGQVN